MSRIRVIAILILVFLWMIEVNAQCNSPNPAPGLFCDPSVPDGAPVLCELSCLDGYTARMPEQDSTLLEWQPERLCDTGHQGDANNLSWFAFVAGSETIRFRITPSNCTVENRLTGVQAGIYSKCYSWDQLYCQGECTTDAFEIGGPGFMEGETYYFFIDGCNGSVCDYSVQVLEGEQPYPLPDIDSIIINSTSDTLCQGEVVEIALAGLTQDSINYQYTITPMTTDYPTGRHPEEFLPRTTWVFSEEGTYEICVSADNGCDQKLPFCTTVVVQSLGNEVFEPVELCIEDLVSYIGPMAEDPNGDGVFGWQNSGFFTPGLNIDTVFQANGCFYTQEVEINLINIANREEVVLYKCPDEFPFLYENIFIDSPRENFSISIDNGSALGCDSLVSLTVREISIAGETIIDDCDDGMGILSFVISDFPLEGSATYDIVWKDPFGNEVMPSAGEPNRIMVDQSGIYTAEVEVNYDTFTCHKIFPSSDININDIKPGLPIALDWNTELCGDDLTYTYRVVTGSKDTVTWAFPNDVRDATFAGDSIMIDWGGSLGGDLCATISNNCGSSDVLCIPINKLFPSQATVDGPVQVCAGDTFSFSFIGDAVNSYTWTLPGSTVIGNPDLSGSGPFQVVITDASNGIAPLVYWVDDGVCQSAEIIYEIIVIDQLETPIVTCLATDNSVLFSWDHVPGAIDYQISVLTGNAGVVDENSYYVTGLNRDDAVTISIQSLSDIDCAHSQIIEATCIAGCDPLDFAIDASQTNFCEGDQVAVDIDPSGDIQQGIVTYFGDGVGDNGVFNPENLAVGNYEIIGVLTVDQCVYRDTIIMNVAGMPEYAYNIEDAQCVEDQLGSLLLIHEAGSGVIFTLDGEEVMEEEIALAAGTYTLIADDGMACPDIRQITINPAVEPAIDLDPYYRIEQGTEVSIPLLLEGFDTTDIVNIEWYDEAGNGLCSGTYETCGEFDFVQEMDMVLCVDVTYNAICTVTRCTEVDFVRVINLYAPNIFSPNGDGQNDVFFIRTNPSDIMVTKFRMFDRWGKIVHAMDDVPSEGTGISWDGRHNDRSVVPGVYLFMLQYEEEGIVYTRTGDVTLIR